MRCTPASRAASATIVAAPTVPRLRPRIPNRPFSSVEAVNVDGACLGVRCGDGCPLYRLAGLVQDGAAHAGNLTERGRGQSGQPEGRERENPQRLHDRKV